MNKLKTFLIVNSIFSMISGSIMILFPDFLDTFFNVDVPYLFFIIGVNLLVFGAMVGYVATRPEPNRNLVNMISVLDGLWVIGSFIIVVFQLFELSQGGYITIAIVGCWIAFLGLNQFRNNKGKF